MTEAGYQGQSGGYNSGAESTPQPTNYSNAPSNNAPSNGDWEYFNQNFKAMVPPQYQAMVSKYPNFVDFLNSYNAQQGLIGKKVSDFANSDWNTYANMMQGVTGIPADPSGYQLEKIEGSVLDADDDAICRTMSHNLGLNNEQANGVQAYMEEAGRYVRESDVQLQENVDHELEQIWGNNYTYKQQALQSAMTDVLPRLLGEPTEAFAQEVAGIVARSSTMARIIAAVGELAMSTPSSGYNVSATTPQGAAATIETLKNDPDFMKKYTTPTHPEHAQAKKTMHQLLKLKHNEF